MRTTDADGRVDVDTRFPGWYACRTIHVHVPLGSDEHVTSRLFFDQALIATPSTRATASPTPATRPTT